mgnify:CR=1 FL=1
MMNKILLFLAIGFATGMLSCSQQTLEKTDSLPQTYTISQERLLDKIKGGWAGQTIGVAYRLAMQMGVSRTISSMLPDCLMTSIWI